MSLCFCPEPLNALSWDQYRAENRLYKVALTPGPFSTTQFLAKEWLHTQHTESPVRKCFSPELKYCECFVSSSVKGGVFQEYSSVMQTSNAVGSPGVKASMSSWSTIPQIPSASQQESCFLLLTGGVRAPGLLCPQWQLGHHQPSN